jgi:hypothetical protein
VTVIVVPFRAGGNATVFAYGSWPGPDVVPSDNPTFANIPVEAAPHRSKTVPVKQKAVAKPLHSASVPAPTIHFLGARAKKPHGTRPGHA